MPKRPKSEDAKQQGRRESSKPSRPESHVRNLRLRSQTRAKAATKKAASLSWAKAIAAAVAQTLALPERETEVLAGLLLHQTNCAIAARLGISANTVATHVRSLLYRFGVADRFAVAEAALELNRRLHSGR